MPEDSWLRRLTLPELLARYKHLRLMPSRTGEITLRGTLEFTASANGRATVNDHYEISVYVPKSYPSELPVVHETNGKIPPDFHKLEGDALCLGSPFRLWLLIRRNPSLLNFIERVVLPYLYGFSLHSMGAEMPFGELEHGNPGLIDDLGEMLGSPSRVATNAYLKAMRLKKRVANQGPCPCGGGVRLGCCHNRQVNTLRKALRRFRAQN
jgi:hypothetical protein